jgi:hypothetical protein
MRPCQKKACAHLGIVGEVGNDAIGGGVMEEARLSWASSERQRDVAGSSASFLNSGGSGELPLSSCRGSWTKGKWQVSAAIDEGEMGSKMAEDIDQKRPPLPPFSSSLAGMLSFLSARERSCSALGFLWGFVGWCWAV